MMALPNRYSLKALPQSQGLQNLRRHPNQQVYLARLQWPSLRPCHRSRHQRHRHSCPEGTQPIVNNRVAARCGFRLQSNGAYLFPNVISHALI